jgi:Resolvase, N terminal domain
MERLLALLRLAQPQRGYSDSDRHAECVRPEARIPGAEHLFPLAGQDAGANLQQKMGAAFSIFISRTASHDTHIFRQISNNPYRGGTTMLCVDGYTRVSTEDQARESVSLDVQASKIEAYCAVKDWPLAVLVTDAGESAKSLKRPGLQRLLERVTRRCYRSTARPS